MYLVHTYVITFMVFPGVTNYTYLTFFDPQGPWYQLFMITIVNFMDTVGRVVGGKVFVSD